ncbi:adenylyl-sulfate kinase [Planosporangium flavigriseum]|uniref:Adenylyl-sulfate kinase n=1 Tax=Planosporangium flavigriseum TaxID=373681 RepID=A0A8J3PL12_9ACTN|nr:adenylyl-sulfate kinase [Planosporangium flavigriseum]NJC64852.1 adenylyl-sulfate kinase [Planosporangium flavigriseum]GIG72724.1 sulfate adenylyltransferase [Planosporangium flavigriseum]
MNNGWVLPDGVLRDAPAYAPRVHELADLELLLTDVYAPLTGFLGRDDLISIARTGRLVDGTAWPVPVTLEVPTDLLRQIDVANPLQRILLLTDAEGAPVAAVDITEVWPTREGFCGVAGMVRRLGEGHQGPFRRLYRPPAEVRELLPPGRVLGVIADRPLHRPQLAQIAHAARTLAGHLLLLVPVAAPGPDGLAPEALVRCILAARDRMPPATIVTIPLVPHGDEVRDALLRARVAGAYGVTHLLATGSSMMSGGLRVLVPRELAYDGRDGQWRTRDDIPPRYQRLPLTTAEIDDLLDRGVALPEWHTPPAVAKELARARPARRHRGLVVFFTGLSGSGKSTIAKGVADVLRETGERTVTLLDGDVVRRHLSKGLGFSAADRDTNVRRIGWVAAEAARHGGVALCCPIAPYAVSRAATRRFATEAGADFVLVHVATPLEECERRDRKGLYAKARAGEITGMTGIDDPYEAPTDADVVIDTTGMKISEAIKLVLRHLGDNGWIDPRQPS